MTTIQPEQKEALDILRRAARARKRTLAKLAEQEAALHLAIREGNRVGIPKLTLFQESGYGARQTIYDVLEGKADA